MSMLIVFWEVLCSARIVFVKLPRRCSLSRKGAPLGLRKILLSDEFSVAWTTECCQKLNLTETEDGELSLLLC